MFGDGIATNSHIKNARCHMPTLRLAELANLTPEQSQEKIREFAGERDKPLNGELAQLSQMLAEFESRYEMTSETMRDKVGRGEQRETADICAWMMWLDVRDRATKPRQT